MTFNRGSHTYLMQALQSLMQQTFQDFEVVFVGQNLNTVYAVEDFLEAREITKVMCWDEGCFTRADRFREGVDSARGEWVVILDCDDLLHPDALWTVYRCLQRFPDFHYFSGSHRAFDSETGRTVDNIAAPVAQMVTSLCHTFKQRHFWGFRNDKTRWPVGIFRHPYPVEDYWFFATLAMNAIAILPIPHIIYGWRVHRDQWTQENKPECIGMCEEIQARLKDWMKKQSPMWHFGDMALATRLTANLTRLEKEIALEGES